MLSGFGCRKWSARLQPPQRGNLIKVHKRIAASRASTSGPQRRFCFHFSFFPPLFFIKGEEEEEEEKEERADPPTLGFSIFKGGWSVFKG